MASSPSSDAALPPMALLATLQTAWTVGESVRERRAGRDPAAQENEDTARAFLERTAEELSRLHMQLLMANVQATRHLEEDGDGQANDAAAAGEADPRPPSDERLAATVRRFDMLMKLRRAARLLHGAHQRLMSLYPAVSEELVEEARRCEDELAALQRGPHGPEATTGEDDFATPLDFFLQRLLSFTAWLEREL